MIWVRECLMDLYGRVRKKAERGWECESAAVYIVRHSSVPDHWIGH